MVSVLGACLDKACVRSLRFGVHTGPASRQHIYNYYTCVVILTHLLQVCVVLLTHLLQVGVVLVTFITGGCRAGRSNPIEVDPKRSRLVLLL